MAMASNVSEAKRIEKLSRKLCQLLRHGAVKAGVPIDDNGFVDVDVFLRRRDLGLNGLTLDDVKYIVATNDKQRFALEVNDKGVLQIRANQGHTLPIKDLDLVPILDADNDPIVVHGTYYDPWRTHISKDGLHRMRRNHIHFAPRVPGDKELVSGARSTCQVLIYIDLSKALNDGYKFFRSANEVILCSGNEEGYLPTEYFLKVTDRKSGRLLPF